MLRKRFYVKINLKLQAITCPGVWLCTHGYLEATIKTLGYFFRTGALEPRFPLLCHDNFNMEGYFRSVTTLQDLERMLLCEQVEITLWQNGRRLAYFVGKLADVLQSHVPQQHAPCTHDYNVQILMKPTTAFPGIIAPKVELCATVRIKDRLQQQLQEEQCGSLAAHRAGSSNSSTSGTSGTLLHVPAKLIPAQHSCLPLPPPAHGACCDNVSIVTTTTMPPHRRHQKPVCHARTCATRSADNSSVPLSEAHEEHNRRRLSNFSSNTLLTMQSFSSNPHSQSSHSHYHPPDQQSLDSNFVARLNALSACQNYCEICQNYRMAFS